MKDLAGKVAFITGGGSGVALGQAKVFAREGMKVVIADIRKDHLDEAMAYFREVGGDVHPIHLDITDRAAYKEAADEAERVFGKVDLLCNTAGVSHFMPIHQATYDDWEWQLSVNLWGVINGIQIFVPRMIENGGGHILNTASMSAFTPLKNTCIYSTTKFAVRGLSENLRLDLERYNIGVSVLCPAAVNTNIHEAILTRPKRLSDTNTPVDEERMKQLKAVIEPGLDPVDLAEKTLKGIKENQLYIIPYPEVKEGLEKLFNEVLESIPGPETDPNMMTRVKLVRERSTIQKM